MATSFIDTFQNLANSFSSATNGFTWDNAIRRFQYAVAGITLGALAIFETTNKMQCSVASQAFPEYYFASSYCFESTWYHVQNVNNTSKRLEYDDNLRYFKWYILIPPVLTIIFSVLYGAVVNGFLVQAVKSASKIMDVWNATGEEAAGEGETSVINKTILNMAIRARVFSETNMHYKKNGKMNCIKGAKCSPTAYGATGDGDKTELFPLDPIYSKEEDEVFFISPSDQLGRNTALYYHFYLFMCLVVNGVAVGFINPYFFWLPNAIACRYQKEDLSFHWSICSVPGYRYFRVGVLIVMINHAVGVLVALMSMFYVNVFVPNELLRANAAIASYTRDPQQQEKLLQTWRKYGKEKVRNLTATTKFLLALIYQNIDRTLCYKLVLAVIDIEKDREAIDFDLPHLISEIVQLDLEQTTITNEDKEDKISEIRETIMNPVGIDQVKDTIQRTFLVNVVNSYLDTPDAVTKILQAQQIQRITGVQLPKLSRSTKDKFVSVLESKNVGDFESPVVYYKFLSAVYDLSKVKQFFTLLQSQEIGHLIGSEDESSVTDNGHEIVGGQHFDGRKAFDTSGYCWRSSDATAYNWLKRTWDRDYTLHLIALQGSHVNRKSSPVRFNFTAQVAVGSNGEKEWVEVSETFRSYDWLNDEWRVFPVMTVNKLNGSIEQPRTSCLQINIFENNGAEYFEIQKIRIYGSN